MQSSLAGAIRQTRPYASLEEEVYISLRLTSQMIDQPWIQHLRRTEKISPSQYNILRILRGAGEEGRTMSQIAERMINRDPDVTRLADHLVARGLARRLRDTADRRVVRLFITQAGLKMLGRLDGPVQVFVAQALGGIGRQRLQQLRELLESVRERMRPFPPEAAPVS